MCLAWARCSVLCKVASKDCATFWSLGSSQQPPLTICALALQRNFWISLFSLSLWVILARVYQILLAKKRLEDEMRGRPARPTGVDTAPTRPTAAAGSATKKAT